MKNIVFMIISAIGTGCSISNVISNPDAFNCTLLIINSVFLIYWFLKMLK